MTEARAEREDEGWEWEGAMTRRKGKCARGEV